MERKIALKFVECKLLFDGYFFHIVSLSYGFFYRNNCKPLAGNDVSQFRNLLLLLHDVFDMGNQSLPGDLQLVDLLNNPAFLAYAVLKDDIVVGGLTAYMLPGYYRAGAEVFIYDVAIGQHHQRAGLGKQLLASFIDYCGKRYDVTSIFVAANKEDSHAISYYLASGGAAEEVIHFNF